MNVAIIVGNLAKNPEIKPLGEKFVVTMVVATSQGDYPTEYHTVKHYTKYAAKYAEYQKGDLIMVDGSVQSRSYEHEGNKKWITEINAKKVAKLNHSPKTEEW
jgi:single-strand DNA-binding protein